MNYDELGMGAVAQHGVAMEPERLSIDDLAMSGPLAEDDLALLEDLPENPIYEGSILDEGAEEAAMAPMDEGPGIGSWPQPEVGGGPPMGPEGAPQRSGEEVAYEMADVLRRKAMERDSQSRQFQDQAQQQGVDQGTFPGGWY